MISWHIIYSYFLFKANFHSFAAFQISTLLVFDYWYSSMGLFWVWFTIWGERCTLCSFRWQQAGTDSLQDKFPRCGWYSEQEDFYLRLSVHRKSCCCGWLRRFLANSLPPFYLQYWMTLILLLMEWKIHSFSRWAVERGRKVFLETPDWSGKATTYLTLFLEIYS